MGGCRADINHTAGESVRKFCLAALFMMVLMVTWPMVSAQELSIQQFSGTQNVDRVAKDTDTVTVKVLVSIPGDAEITPGQVHLVNEAGVTYLFSTCSEKDSGAFECSMSFDVVGRAGYEVYTITLFNDDNQEVANTAALLTNDAVDPDMISFTVDPSITGSTTTIGYEAKD